MYMFSKLMKCSLDASDYRANFVVDGKNAGVSCQGRQSTKERGADPCTRVIMHMIQEYSLSMLLLAV